ncbi:MAG: cytochrome oxidase assembly protein [Rhodocyclaceae bacterium]|nr:MAG: cytochrome oxidase assembly protein [Rhodocyclaceae bacterium]
MAIACAVLVLAITSLSAYIRLGNVGLGCADWPQCYGSKLRQAQQGIDTRSAESGATVAARMLHRIVAVAALLLIIVMAMACFAGKPILWREGWMAMTLLVLALFLAVLGRWSGGARVPAVNIGNLLGGFAMLAFCWRLHQRASEAPAAPEKFRTRLLAWLAVLTLLGQIALGGLVSAAFAGLSCTAMPGCGAGVPTTMTLDALDPWREPMFPETVTPPANPAGAAAHMAHRYGAIAMLLAIALLAWSAIRSGRGWPAWTMLGLLAIEISLGVLLVAQSLPLGVALAHNLTAALLLAAVFVLV